ncbi:MAG: hypothetical protein VXY82_10690 [Planctomycetota bacterium]|nr:hypothetical protein [Planctomycetota bacterium]
MTSPYVVILAALDRFVYGKPVYGKPVYGKPVYGKPVYGKPDSQRSRCCR